MEASKQGEIGEKYCTFSVCHLWLPPMAGNVYVRSLKWLVSCSAVGYGLLILTRPSEEKLQRIRETTSTFENYQNERRNILFSQQLQKAIGLNEPLASLPPSPQQQTSNDNNRKSERK